MPTMQELSVIYHANADTIHRRIVELREQKKAAKDTVEAERLFRRILDLQPLYKEARALAILTECYYERSYHKDEHYTL